MTDIKKKEQELRPLFFGRCKKHPRQFLNQEGECPICEMERDEQDMWERDEFGDK